MGSAVRAGTGEETRRPGPETSVWVAVERLAVIGFLLALVLSFIIVFRLVWRWFSGATPDAD